MENKIHAFFHCKKCLKELPKDQSPREYAQIEVGWTEKGFQVWCKRHESNIAALDFMGQKITYDQDERLKTPERKEVN